jgi:prophage tail gpP-like protein
MNDDLTLIVGGRRLSGWTSIRVGRGIERCPSDFEVTMTELFPNEVTSFVIQPGDACKVLLGTDQVINGYVDRFSPSMDATLEGGQHSIRVVGRGKCADLVDCAAEWPGGQITGSSVLEIAHKLVLPYGVPGDSKSAITVSTDVADVGPVIPQFNLMLGESPFEIIERICRYAALLAYEEHDGNLFLTRVGSTKAASGFMQGVNVQRASVDFSIDQRFSVVQAFIQSFDTLADLGDGGNLRAEVTDFGVKRHRKKVIIAESGDTNFEVAKKRAVWEVVRRYGRSAPVHITTDSWRDKDGVLWTPNTLVDVSLPSLKVGKDTLLISEVTYLRNGQSGTTAELVLMRPEAFIPQPVVFLPAYTDVQPAANR